MPIIAKQSIRGESVISPRALAAFLHKHNATPRINTSTLDLAQLYIAEGQTLNIRGDIAFCQAMHETNFFKFGAKVLPDQNNFANIDAPNASPIGQGAWFETPEIGVRAQIQQLYAHSCKEPLPADVIKVAPHFDQITRGAAKTVAGMNNSTNIIALYNKLEAFAAELEHRDQVSKQLSGVRLD